MRDNFSFDNLNDNILFENIQNKHAEYLLINIFGGNAAIAANYGTFFTARHACEVLFISEVHEVAGGAGALLQIEKLTGTTAPGAGINLLTTSFNLNAAANTVQTRDATTTFDFVRSVNLPTIINVGERLALKHNGAGLAGTSGVSVTIYLKPLGRGHYR